MPTPSQSLSAVVVSGGKQYRVAPGDRILVDRLAADAGSELTLDRVLLVADGDDVKVEAAALEGLTVTARVIGDRRGPKIDVLRYKSKKRVRVHRGARADLTALEILTVAGKGVEKPEQPAAAAEQKPKPATRGRAKPAAAEPAPEPEVEAAKAPRRTRAKAEGKSPADTEKETSTDGA